jgi:tight adherence protein B
VNQAIIIMTMGVVFTALLAIAQGAYWAWVAKQERVQEELVRRLSGQSNEAYDESILLNDEPDNTALSLGSAGEKLHQMIVSADAKISVSQFVTYMIISGGAGMLGGGMATGSFVGTVVGIPAAAVPYFYIRRQGTIRGQALVSQLPDALDLMSRSLQAGLGLNDAFKLVAEEMPMPIAAEFGRVFEEVRFGRDYREAFQKMMDRNPGIFDLRLMVSSVLLQRETGGNLIEILENIAGTIRARFGFMAKVRAMTAEAKFSALILGSLPLAVMTILTVSNPDYLNPLFQDPKGNVIIFIDLCMYSVGIFIMSDMINVKV